MATRNMFDSRLMAEPDYTNNTFGSSGLFSSSTPSQPKIALFGDSISSAVGYGEDSQPDTKYGGSVADVLSKKLGTPVANMSMGGVTTKDALSGSAIPYAGQNLAIPYGNFQQYLQTEKPNVVLLRFGAADAIRLNDPKQTLANIQQMVTMAKESGATPILVGVSPFAKGGDSRAGNINAGSIDPYISAAEEINKGIQQIANQNGLNFVDMQKLEVPKGALLDGVHPTADFGNKMAEYIGNAVTAALPQFGGSPEKFQAFSQSAPSKAVEAANAVSSTPTTERILSEGGGAPVNINGTVYQPIFDSTGQGETFEQGPLKEIVSYKPGETATGQSYKTYSPTMEEIGTNKFQKVGNIGTMLQTAAEDLAPLAAMALTAGGAGGALGGFLTGGGLTGTAASALGNALISGTAGALTGQDPLKAALLSAGGTYVGSLFGGPSAATVSDAENIAQYAQELTAQGLPYNEVQRILEANGVSSGAAASAADYAEAGLSVRDIADKITSGKGLFTGATSTVSPDTVTTDPLTGLQTATTTGAAPVVNAGDMLGGLPAAVPAAVTPQGNIVSTTMAPLDQPSQITVTGERAPELNLGDILATINPSLIGPDVGPQRPLGQTVTTTGTKEATSTADDLAAAIAATVNPSGLDVGPPNPLDQTVTTTGTKATDNTNLASAITALNTVVSPGLDVGPQKIDITGAKNTGVTSEDTGATIGTIAGTTLTGVGPQSGGGVETQDQTDRTVDPNSLLSGLTLADILKALTTASTLGLLGGDSTGVVTPPVVPKTPVPVGNADYYKAIQQYYNTYMPQTPRDVATPLQQWYEGKFGG